MTDQKSTNITWHEGHVTREDREELLSQRGATIWLTGLSGSGKSTIAVAADLSTMKKLRLECRLPVSGRPRSADSCHIEVGN